MPKTEDEIKKSPLPHEWINPNMRDAAYIRIDVTGGAYLTEAQEKRLERLEAKLDEVLRLLLPAPS